MNLFNRKKINFSFVFALYNTILFCYIVGNKYNSSINCATCHQAPFLPVSDLFVANAGLLTSIFLLVISYFINRNRRAKFLMLILAGASAGVSTFLQVGQFFYYDEICILCVAVWVGFWLILCSIHLETCQIAD